MLTCDQKSVCLACYDLQIAFRRIIIMLTVTLLQRSMSDKVS